jgi:general stress protein 26
MSERRELRETIRHLLASQRLAVLATQCDGQPYTSLVTLAATEDLARLIFPTLRSSTKYTHLSADSRVALLLDNRCDQAPGSPDAVALTAIGIAREASPQDMARLTQLYLSRHPHLRGFLQDPDCALVQVQVRQYRLVRQLQDVSELDMAAEGI